MLLPPFSGVGLKAFDRDRADITDRLFLPNEFMRVDADYTPSHTSNGERPTGRGPTSHPSTATCSRPGLRSRRHTRSRSHTRAPTAQ